MKNHITLPIIKPVNAPLPFALRQYKAPIIAGANCDNKTKDSTINNDFKAYGPFSEMSKSEKIDNVYFVGDAYKFLDGITGEGISLGLRSAKLISENFNSYGMISKIKLRMMYLKYTICVFASLSLSRNLNFRKFIFSLLKRFPYLMNLALKFND